MINHEQNCKNYHIIMNEYFRYTLHKILFYIFLDGIIFKHNYGKNYKIIHKDNFLFNNIFIIIMYI